MKIIDIYYFRGWNRKDKREFWVSLFLTLAICVIVYVFAVVLQMMPKQ